MTAITFFYSDLLLQGFHITGHSTASAEDEQGRLVCAAVSSAAFLVANTITEVIGATADIQVRDGEMKLTVKSNLEDCLAILSGFLLHMEQLAEQYKGYIAVNSEV